MIISLQTLFDDSPVFEPHITITSGIVLNNLHEIDIILNSALAAINSLNQINERRHNQANTSSNVDHNDNNNNNSHDSLAKKDTSDGAGANTNTNTNSSSLTIAVPDEAESSISGSASLFSPMLDHDPKDDLVFFESLEFGKKFFQKVYFAAYPNPNLLSFARIMRELFVEVPRLKMKLVAQEQQKQQQQLRLKLAADHQDSKRRRSKSFNQHANSTSTTTANANANANAAGGASNTTKNATSDHGSGNNTLSPEPTPINVADINPLAMRNAQEWCQNEFKPHLSLVYSGVYTINAALARTIRTRIEDLLNVIILDDVNASDGSNSGGSINGGTFGNGGGTYGNGIARNRIIDDNQNLAWPADGSLRLVECEGPVKDWKVLGSIDYHLSS